MYRIKVTSGIVTPLSRVEYTSPPSYKAGQVIYEILAGFKMDIGVGRCHMLCYRNFFYN